jgi:hypothetical protein
MNRETWMWMQASVALMANAAAALKREAWHASAIQTTALPAPIVEA